MNEFLRVFKRTFKLFGYDLKKAGKFTLQPLKNQPDIFTNRLQIF